jgi:hypothetical protein
MGTDLTTPLLTLREAASLNGLNEPKEIRRRIIENRLSSLIESGAISLSPAAVAYALCATEANVRSFIRRGLLDAERVRVGDAPESWRPQQGSPTVWRVLLPELRRFAREHLEVEVKS